MIFLTEYRSYHCGRMLIISLQHHIVRVGLFGYVIYYMIWIVYQRIQGVNGEYGNHRIFAQVWRLPKKAESASHVTRKCTLIGQFRDTVDDATRRAIFRPCSRKKHFGLPPSLPPVILLNYDRYKPR